MLNNRSIYSAKLLNICSFWCIFAIDVNDETMSVNCENLLKIANIRKYRGTEGTYVNGRVLLSLSHDKTSFSCGAFSCPFTLCISDPFVVSAFAMTLEYLGHTCESFTNSEQFSFELMIIR